MSATFLSKKWQKSPAAGLPAMNNPFLCRVKVMILHQHFNLPHEGGPLRSYFLAKALVTGGLTPVVITSRSEERYRSEIYEGIEIHYLPVAYNNRFGFRERSVSFLRYVWKAIRLAGKLRDVKVCYAISVPLTVGLAAQSIRLRYKIPYIFEVGDLWPEAPIQMGFVRNYFFKRMLFALEKSIYNSALSIVALSPPIRSAIESKVPGKKVYMIPNMADTEFFKPEEKDGELEVKYNVGEKFVVSYIGAVGLANGLEFFVDCARASQVAGIPVHFLLCGDGAMVDPLQEKLRRDNISNLTFISFQNRAGVREIMNVSDAIFVCYKTIPVLETGSPNKYFDGLAAGKLIVINFGGWIAKEIMENRCGVSVDPADPDDFIIKVQPFLQQPELLHEYQRASRNLALSRYSRDMLGETYRGIFNTPANDR